MLILITLRTARSDTSQKEEIGEDYFINGVSQGNVLYVVMVSFTLTTYHIIYYYVHSRKLCHFAIRDIL